MPCSIFINHVLQPQVYAVQPLRDSVQGQTDYQPVYQASYWEI